MPTSRIVELEIKEKLKVLTEHLGTRSTNNTIVVLINSFVSTMTTDEITELTISLRKDATEFLLGGMHE